MAKGPVKAHYVCGPTTPNLSYTLTWPFPPVSAAAQPQRLRFHFVTSCDFASPSSRQIRAPPSSQHNARLPPSLLPKQAYLSPSQERPLAERDACLPPPDKRLRSLPNGRRPRETSHLLRWPCAQGRHRLPTSPSTGDASTGRGFSSSLFPRHQ